MFAMFTRHHARRCESRFDDSDRSGRHHGHHHFGHHRRGPKMFDAGALRYIVLQLIADQPRHGYELIKEIGERIGGGYSPSPGVIYPLLTMLEDLGHVVVSQNGNKKLHTITPEGLAFLEENRALVDAVVARLNQRESANGSQPESNLRRGGGIREAMRELKIAVISRVVRGAVLNEAQMTHIAEILRQAAADVAKV